MVPFVGRDVFGKVYCGRRKGRGWHVARAVVRDQLGGIG
ncbi:hypothetical protein FOWG_10641 [Fusarium oxysporum f. sp. lycopersici MN25]|nr:hypothetical protein FOWG_10641 [Fusarium oxysporum f. sp. lycopersici MN25]